MGTLNKKHKKTIPENYIKNYLKLFVNSVIEDPSFDSQSKERLITTQKKLGSKPNISEKFIKKIYFHFLESNFLCCIKK